MGIFFYRPPPHHGLKPIYNRLTADRFYARTPPVVTKGRKIQRGRKKNRRRGRESCRFCKQASGPLGSFFPYAFCCYLTSWWAGVGRLRRKYFEKRTALEKKNFERKGIKGWRCWRPTLQNDRKEIRPRTLLKKKILKRGCKCLKGKYVCECLFYRTLNA